ncbi:hypothetical protein DESUT3_16200 [Desulfuromonas versatilis]|uniref:tRNA/rRNA methyltransferase SpoU type domain-containing protein n=1 Tax=Desulfuromonas versatilis TaxID=2802975 RepID=A0ABM8HU28_9BACT|nr:TrmH family RNA methyltransferase [Desulfuromonas versatilis]BCR04551.1 hypothetical protein DESUT3_16200 [Desulfuromonas versatilis]
MKARTKDILLRYGKERQRNLLARPGVHDYVVVLDSLKPGFNIPKVFRSAEALGAREVHLIDIGPFDPAPAKGSFRKVPARFHDNFQGCWDALRAQGYDLFLLDPAGENPLPATALPGKSAFVFGHEEWGFSFDPANYPGLRRLAIPQYGQVQSLNVSIAASIVMYEYVRQHGSR